MSEAHDDLTDDFDEPPVPNETEPGDYEPAPAAAVPVDARTDYSRESYAWAQDVFFVYEHLGDSAKKAKTFSAARAALHAHAKKNMENFLGQLLPKAMQLFEKSKDKQGDGDLIVREEKKSIAKLRDILFAAMEEAKDVTP